MHGIKKEIFDFIDDAKYMVRPANFPQNNPGKGLVFLNVNGIEVAIINLQGRTFLAPIDDPFTKIDILIEEAKKEQISYLLTFMQKQQVKNKHLVGMWMVE